MPYTNLLLGMTDAMRTTILNEINLIEATIPKLVSLTTKEKKAGFTFGKRADSVFLQCLALMKNAPEIVPPSFSISDFTIKVKDREILTEIHGRIGDLFEALGTTLKANEQECTLAVLSFYKYAQAAATQNLPGAKQAANEMAEMVNKKRKVKGITKKTTTSKKLHLPMPQ